MGLLTIDYNSEEGTATFVNQGIRNDIWESLFQKISVAFSSTDAVLSGGNIVVPWRVFLRSQTTLKQFYYIYEIETSFTDRAKAAIEKAGNDDYCHACSMKPLPENEILQKLSSVGFTRVLTKNQLSNVSKIAPLPSAATFSVPGAGKTTEALAFYYINRAPGDKLLVVAPKNALISWDKELLECVKGCKDHFVRLQGGEDAINRQLMLSPNFMIITYQQFPRVKDLLAHFLTVNEVFVFLDESHRIKAGTNGLSAKAILDLCPLAKRKLVLSGTPAPQRTGDLNPQFSFLYPEQFVSEETVVSEFSPVFVRTTSNQLGIPNIKYELVNVELPPLQRKVYDSLKSSVARELHTFNITDYSKDNLQKIGKSVMKVMQYVSNPSLLSSDLSFSFNQEFTRVLCAGDGPKIAKVIKLARQIVGEKGQKVVIWSTFVKNVELLSMRLKDLGANFIDGGVPTGDINDPATREYRIDRFLNDKSCKVLVANPAACSESISLHTACHNAIYLDRSFNAAHFMQSEDRIHRLGLTETPVIYIVECDDTIDQVVDKRLKEKIQNMAKALNDPSIIVSDFETNPESDEDEDQDLALEEEEYMNQDDAKALLHYFFGE